MAVCIDAMGSNVRTLKKAYAESLPDPTSLGVDYVVIHAAVSNHIGTAEFPDMPAGFEQASLGAGAQTQTAKVNVSTLPALMDQLQLSAIDHLSIDVEGFDPLVLQGAYPLFKSHSVDFLEFEVNNKGPWLKTSLGGIVRDLDGMGYDCYYPTNKGGLVPLTGCMTEQHDQLRWGNVACLGRWAGASAKVRRRARALQDLLNVDGAPAAAATAPLDWKPENQKLSPSNPRGWAVNHLSTRLDLF